jgi:hypothetical protein
MNVKIIFLTVLMVFGFYFVQAQSTTTALKTKPEGFRNHVWGSKATELNIIRYVRKKDIAEQKPSFDPEPGFDYFKDDMEQLDLKGVKLEAIWYSYNYRGGLSQVILLLENDADSPRMLQNLINYYGKQTEIKNVNANNTIHYFKFKDDTYVEFHQFKMKENPTAEDLQGDGRAKSYVKIYSKTQTSLQLSENRRKGWE